MVPIVPMASVVVVIEEKNVKKFIQLENSTSEDKELYDSLMSEIKKLKINPYHADSIPKRLIPKKYKIYKNLWRSELPKGWRYLYTVKNVGKDPKTGKGIIEVTIVDWMTHGEYNRLFGYH